jgi:hypothetical protein
MKITNLCITIFLVSVFCFLSIHAMAEEDTWRIYYISPDGTKYLYDSKSVVRTSKELFETTKKSFKPRKVRSKVWLVKVKEKTVFNKPDNRLIESRILREFDCSEKRVRMVMKSDFFNTFAQFFLSSCNPEVNRISL